jgi:hypothetical protein
VFDLIYASGGPLSGQRWQVIEPGPGGAAIRGRSRTGRSRRSTRARRVVPAGVYGFESLASAAYADLAGVDRAAETHEQAIASVSDPTALDAQLGAVVDDGGRALDDHARALDALDVGELLARDPEANRQIDDPQGEWDGQNPANLPDLPDDTSPWLGYVPDTPIRTTMAPGRNRTTRNAPRCRRAMERDRVGPHSGRHANRPRGRRRADEERHVLHRQARAVRRTRARG